MTSVALALAAHRIGECQGHCTAAREVLRNWESNGSTLIGLLGRLPIGLLAIEHHSTATSLRDLVSIAHAIIDQGVGTAMRRWLRRLAPHAAAMLRSAKDPSFLVKLVAVDPDYWTPLVADLIPSLKPDWRRSVLAAMEEAANLSTSVALRSVDGADVLELRRRLVNRFAAQVRVRSLGPLVIHKGSWNSPSVPVTRRRLRLLLGLLVATNETGLTRDEVLDILWPDSDPASAVNSLNQTVFQLRRLFDPDYREGESPQYVLSSTEAVQLNPDLVLPDVRQFSALCKQMRGPNDTPTRILLAEQIIDFIRGEFLADVKYEDWAASSQVRVHSIVRANLLPVATGELAGIPADLQIRAGHALTMLDPYDETAHVAIARSFANSGRRSQARDLLRRYTRRLRDDLAEEPSDDLRLAASLVGADLGQLSLDPGRMGLDFTEGTT
jgi:DNA-binding SARP family transcriptional activator